MKGHQIVNLTMTLIAVAALTTAACVSVNYHEAGDEPLPPVVNVQVGDAQTPPVPIPAPVEAEPEVQSEEVQTAEPEPEVQSEPEPEPRDLASLNYFMQTFSTAEIMSLLQVACDGEPARASDRVTMRRFDMLLTPDDRAEVLDVLCLDK